MRAAVQHFIYRYIILERPGSAAVRRTLTKIRTVLLDDVKMRCVASIATSALIVARFDRV